MWRRFPGHIPCCTRKRPNYSHGERPVFPRVLQTPGPASAPHSAPCLRPTRACLLMLSFLSGFNLHFLVCLLCKSTSGGGSSPFEYGCTGRFTQVSIYMTQRLGFSLANGRQGYSTEHRVPSPTWILTVRILLTALCLWSFFYIPRSNPGIWVLGTCVCMDFGTIVRVTCLAVHIVAMELQSISHPRICGITVMAI